MAGTLYLVATPIGNLKDISYRALDVLREVDVIACEDTRHTLKLLNHYRIANRLISYHEHNEKERAEELIEKLVAGDSVAIVSDAGTPGICDPAFRLVQRASEVGVQVVAIPGPVAFVNAAVASGIATDAIFFGGFLPAKEGERRKRLEEVKNIAATLVFYEAPHRLEKSLVDCSEVLGNRHAAVARELTKLHEEIVRATLTELADRYKNKTVKGEIVLVIERSNNEPPPPAGPVDKLLTRRIKELEDDGSDPKSALKKAAKELGLTKQEAYKLVLKKKK